MIGHSNPNTASVTPEEAPNRCHEKNSCGKMGLLYIIDVILVSFTGISPGFFEGVWSFEKTMKDGSGWIIFSHDEPSLIKGF